MLPDAEYQHLSEAVLRPVRGHHAFEACVEQLATAIRLGVYPDGGALPSERVLSERLGVSRGTLREAMAALRASGLVETRRGRGGGTFVTHSPGRPKKGRRAMSAVRREAWLDALVFRRVVEGGAAAVAAERELTAADEAMLTEAHDAVAQASDPARHRQADSRFHLAVATLSGSPRLVDAVTSAQSSLHDMLMQIPVLAVNIEHSDRQHRTIHRAILRGDPVRARRTMEEHCDDTAALLRGLLG